MKRIIFSLLFTMLVTFSVTAGGGNLKATTIEGRVIDDEGNPVIGAKVMLLDSKKEVYTDFEGAFTFKNIITEEQSIKVTYLSHEDLVAKVDLKETRNTEIELSIQSR